MRTKLQLIAVLAAWFIATGSHWDVIQMIGWSRMIVNNTQSMSLADAVRQTFDPQEMCGVCHAVQDAKRDQDEAAAGTFEAKAPLIVQTGANVFVGVPAGESLPGPGEAFMCGTERMAPPVPPPRVGLV